MTAAVCVACGAQKVGAWTPCPRCSHDATTDTGRARALLLSDRHLDAAALAAASEEIEAGRSYVFDEARVRELSESLAHGPRPTKVGLVFAVFGFLALVGALGLMLVLVVRWFIGVVT